MTKKIGSWKAESKFNRMRRSALFLCIHGLISQNHMDAIIEVVTKLEDYDNAKK